MKKVLGLILFSFGAGMAFMFFLPQRFCVVILIAAILIVGYNLFCT